MPANVRPIVFGAPYSVYVRAVRLALEEKGVDYELVPVDIFASEGQPAEHMARHPFGKIPAFEHAGFRQQIFSHSREKISQAAMTPEQYRAARAWLGLSQQELATRANVAKNTVHLFEA